MNNNFNIVEEALHQCYKEMYAKAQPSIDYDELVSKVKSGEIKDSRENPVYNRHYLSQEEFEYIKNKYIELYNLSEKWTSNIELLESYLSEGGTKDKYIPDMMEEDGHWHPGYRSYENVKPLKTQLEELIGNKAEDIYNLVMSNISTCKNYYKFDRNEAGFNYAICLGASPTSNKDTVIDYWKEQGVDITIEDRNPLTFWDRDEYGDEFEEVMKEEYGNNWEEILDAKYNTEKAEKEALRKKEHEEYIKNYKYTPNFKVGDFIRSANDLIVSEVVVVNDDNYVLKQTKDNLTTRKTLSITTTDKEYKKAYEKYQSL